VDNDFGLDLEEVRRNVETADVLTFWFPLLRKTLLIDTRRDEGEAPLVRVVPSAHNVEERLRTIKKLRPKLPTPERVTMIPWPRYTSSLRSLGVWDAVLGRLNRLGDAKAVQDIERAWQVLSQLERDEIESAIRGAGYKAIWERAAPPG
jgi:hypothetical protein